MAEFPDIEAIAHQLLTPYGTCGTATPDDFTVKLPFIRANRIGGVATRLIDHPVLEVSVFENTYAAGWGLAQGIFAFLVDCPHTSEAGQIDSLVSASGPAERPWNTSSTVRRWLATFTFSVRSRPS